MFVWPLPPLESLESFYSHKIKELVFYIELILVIVKALGLGTGPCCLHTSHHFILLHVPPSIDYNGNVEEFGSLFISNKI